MDGETVDVVLQQRDCIRGQTALATPADVVEETAARDRDLTANDPQILRWGTLSRFDLEPVLQEIPIR